MDLNGALVFVRVARLGSFTKAALDLGLPASTVSDRISDLEKALGVRLLVRTTRKLRLTDAGSVFFREAELAVAALLSAGEEAALFQKKPTGALKMTAPVDFDLSSISPALTEYLDRFPDVRIELLLTNRVVDLIGEGVDIAIRAGAVEHSSFSAKLLGMAGFILIASPEYVEKSPEILQPSDLTSHKCLVISPEDDASGAAAWNLISTGDKKARIEPQARIASNSVSAIKHLVSIGEGIALLPPTVVHDDLAKGRMVHVLPAWSTAPQPIYLVHTAHRNAPLKVREMLPLLEPRLRGIIREPGGI